MNSSAVIQYKYGPAVDAVLRPTATPSATYGRLVAKGFRSDEAGNITAYMWGLSPVKGGWQPPQLAALLALRHAVRHEPAANRHALLRDDHSPAGA